VLVRATADGEADDASGRPLRFLPESSLPSTRPVLVSGAESILWVLVRGAAPGTSTMPVRVIGREWKEVARVEATALERSDSGIAGSTLMRVRLPLPALDPGPYLLELSATAMNPDVQLTSSTPVVVADRKTVDAQPLWVQFGTPRQSGDEQTRSREAFSGRAGRVKASAKLAAEYRSALAGVDSEPLPAVLDALSALESASLPTGSAAEWETLVASETQAARELAKARPASALALAYVHNQLYRAYLRKRMNLLVSHARRMTEEFAVLYAEHGGKDARPIAADLLAELGGGLQQPGMLGTAERLFRRALQFDPKNRAALIGLAAGLEHVGQYRLAAGFLSQLVDVDPTNPEARLRLGVNLERLGEQGKGAAFLKECAGEKNPRWVRIVAYQEMAADLIRAGRFEQARGLLEEARTKLPGDEALAITLAYVLDRLHEPLGARAVANGVRPPARDDGDSPRFRYSQWPTDDLERSGQAIAEAGPRALGDLREALLAPPATGGKS
jgi:Flp pilus assembly protein TadD